MLIRDLRTPRAYEHVVLSPHLDDAALSMGGTIAALTTAGERVLVVTVCAGSPDPLKRYGALARKYAGRDPLAWVQVRHFEEQDALAVLGADLYLGTALDAIFRYPRVYRSGDTLFGLPDPSDRLAAHTYGLCALLVSLQRLAHFYAPLGIGGHVDHQLVFEAALRGIPRARLSFYEDFPYVAVADARERRLAELTRRGLRFRTRARSVELARKIKAIAAYESQVPALFESVARMRQTVRRHGEEVFYALKPRRGPSRASAPSST